MLVRLLLVAALAAGVASAQRSRGGGGENRNMDDFGSAPRQQRTTRFETIGDKLKLSKEQKEQATTIFDAAQEAAGPINEQIQQGRNRITGAIVENQNSGEEFEKLMTAYTGLLEQMTAVEATAYGKLYAILKPNQQPKAAQVFAEQMSGLFTGRDWKRMR